MSNYHGQTVAVLFVYIFLEIQRDIRDYLTGLLNRQQIDELISDRIRDRQKKNGFCLVMIDMDGFKAINDAFSHDEGDKALVRLARLLQTSIKGIDRAARFGGYEFVLLLETGIVEEIQAIMSRIDSKLDEDNRNAGTPYRIAFSASYCVFDPSLHKDYNDLLHAADQSMYKVKQSRKQVVQT